MRWGKQRWCPRCYRIRHMIQAAHVAYPDWRVSWDDIDSLMTAIEPEMRCPHCHEPMFLDGRAGRGHVASLQHYRDGRLGIICNTCNVGHGHSHLGDAYFDVPRHQKYCPTCMTIKDRTLFGIARRRMDGRTWECKDCISARGRARRV